ncbi:LysE family translocator [Micromonospora krabiensis]|uniref:Threonine/homoserine/homoserine lactone efflux protein n=1 Tax=Micromonospora krabiensis TaxID=307121 RepID=A0A1C3N725_9ACTN|nr:LysE family translocator [Micromonospora krabiensis]SBV28343.1 Threonine/homoserine/homoserine lactone efflux protein [Micromonospora krabiensis]
MPPAPAIAGFLVAILPLIAIPGASLTLLTNRVLPNGPTSGLPVILGTATGLYVHAGLAAAGLSALVLHSSQAFTAVRLTGAAYLVALGVWTWRTARDGSGTVRRQHRPRHRLPGRRAPGGTPIRRAVRALTRPGRSAYGQALLGNVLNPKAASIFLTLVPQFVDPRGPVVTQILVLATAQVLLITAWLLGWTVLLVRAGRMVRSRRFVRASRQVTGAVLVALGIRAAVAR